jgi:hypothetical protein
VLAKAFLRWYDPTMRKLETIERDLRTARTALWRIENPSWGMLAVNLMEREKALSRIVKLEHEKGGN